jgi:hypothetical protein
MLNLTSFLDFHRREVVMSPVDTETQTQVVTSAGRTVTGPQRVDATQELSADDRSQRMQPWSIGTTRLAKEHLSRREECPPEVYIG